MCLFWTCKYTLCGCIWDRPPSLCPDIFLCWGPRMVTLESHTATCAECWARGDKRVIEEATYNTTDGYREQSNRKGSNCASDTGTDDSDDSSEVDENYVEAEEFPLPNSSRPATPYLYAEIHSELCPIADDNEFDLSRVCDPVKLASIWRDYRARRQVTQDIALWEDESDTESFVSCQEYLDDQDRDDDTSYEEALGEGALNEEALREWTLDEEDTDPKNNGEDENAYYSMLGSFIREKTPLERLEDESLEFYGSPKNYYGEWEQENNLKPRLCW